MTTITEPTTVRHNVGTCPACRAYLWAEVDIAVRVISPPTLDRDGKAHAYAAPHFLGMRVEHYCARDEDGGWVEIADSRPETAPRTDAEASEVPEGQRDAENATETDTQRVAREVGIPDDHPWLAGCGCFTCTSQRVDRAGLFMPMCVCADCGNKRCPRATHHDNECTGSNEPGQMGSRFA